MQEDMKNMSLEEFSKKYNFHTLDEFACEIKKRLKEYFDKKNASIEK